MLPFESKLTAIILITSFFLSDSVPPTKFIAIVEYQPVQERNLSPKQRLLKNTQNYVNIINEISFTGIPIFLIIFPESGLDYGRGSKLQEFAVEFPGAQNHTPCINQHAPEFIRKLSCAARDTQTSILFNLITKSVYGYCSTDVVIDGTGQVVYIMLKDDRVGEPDLHHKPIPFEIPNLRFLSMEIYQNDSTNPKDIIVINPTSFVCGFRFSRNKAIVLNSTNRHYLILSNWISQLPFLTSLQVYQMWAQEFNLTIYFSGLNDPKKGRGGTGIYHRNGGPIMLDVLPKGGTKVYVYAFVDNEHPGELFTDIHNETVDEIAQEFDNFRFETASEITAFKSQVLDQEKSNHSLKLCYKQDHEPDFCCEFSAETFHNKSLEKSHNYVYQFVAYKGPKDYYGIFKPGGIEVCALIACKDSKLSSCGKRFPDYRKIGWPLTFLKLEIKAYFALPHEERIYYSSQFPNSLLSSMRPIHPNFTRWESIVHDTRLERRFSLTQEQDRLLTFAIYGRNFSIGGLPTMEWSRALKKDAEHQKGKTEFLSPSAKLMLCCFVVQIVVNKYMRFSCCFVFRTQTSMAVKDNFY